MTLRMRKWAPTNSSQAWNATIQSIELENACLDRNRQAPGANLPVPWPFEFGGRRGSDQARAIAARIEGSVRDTFQKFGITYKKYDVQSLKRRGIVMDPQETLILLTTDDQSSSKGVSPWWYAANEIQCLLDEEVRQAQHTKEIRVEIRNEDLMRTYMTSNVPRNFEAFDLLARMRSSVIQRIRETIQFPGPISFVMRGNRNEEKIPTVLIGVPPGTVFDWDFLYERTMDMVENFCVGKVEVEMIPDIIQTGISEEQVGIGYKCQDRLPSMARNGCSIGPRGTSKAGSIGVWVHLKPPNGDRKIALLTTYNVVSSSRELSLNDDKGIGLSGVPVTTEEIIVDYPAPIDAIQTEKILNTKISQGEFGEDNTNLKLLDTIERYRKHPGIGHVAYASGIRKNNSDKSMDWAIIIISDQQNLGQNIPPHQYSLRTILDTNGLDRDEFDYAVKAEEVVSVVANVPVPDEWLVKRGRTTDVTTGNYSGIKDNVDWGIREDDRFITDEHVMRNNTLMALGGDSGAMVINQRKEWVGILTGYSTCSAAAYFTCAQDIIDDVRDKTGCIISLLSDD